MTTDLRQLRRLSGPDHRGRGRRRRDPWLGTGRGPTSASSTPTRRRPILIAAAVVVAVVGALIGVTRMEGAPTLDPQVVAASAGDAARIVDPRPDRGARSAEALAEVRGLTLRAVHPAPVAVGFLEGLRPDALSMTPIGRLVDDTSGAEWDAPPDQPGPDYRVLELRGGTRGPTSGVNVVVDHGATVRSPITGEVVAVESYSLHPQVEDTRVRIAPDGVPGLEVVVMHVASPSVGVGDRVTGGSTPIGVAGLLRVPTQADDLMDGERLPHVHLEVRPAQVTRTPDPNAPATAPDTYVRTASE